MQIRPATRADVGAIVRLLADDHLGARRERAGDPPPSAYYDGFDAMARQCGNQTLVAVEDDGVIGCLQLTFIAGLARRGMTRAQIEGVRVDQRFRGGKVGEALFQSAIQLPRDEGCGLVQLTTDKTRPDAHQFYRRFDFVASHEGFKRTL